MLYGSGAAGWRIWTSGSRRCLRRRPAWVREGVSLDQAQPLQTTRWADDTEGPADLAVLLGTLIDTAQRRHRHG